MPDSSYQSAAALNDFRDARRRAGTARIVARLTGRSDDLLVYEDIRQKLKGRLTSQRTLADIPLSQIVGSVGRPTDFNREFLPLNLHDAERWARVKVAMEGQAGVPPIEVYQIGEAYFVLDGNHRVSIARASGAKTIQAFVTKIATRVPLSATDSPDDLIRKAEYADFLELTELDETRPSADLRVTTPGRYQMLENAIEAQRLQLSQNREVSIREAAANWYDTIYLPAVQIIRDQQLLDAFPGRTETDLYVWLSEHRAQLKQELGWEIEHDVAARDLAQRFSDRTDRTVARIGGQILSTLTPDALESGPSTGIWRGQRPERERLFESVLVGISGAAAGWMALDQALVVAQQDGGRIAGLHIVANERSRSDPAAQAVQQEFDRRCAAGGVTGRLLIDVGSVTDQLCDRARLNDLVVVSLSYPPGESALARVRSGFRNLVRRCPRPILAVPTVCATVRRVLLSYDSSPKAEEALYIAAYMATAWGATLSVLTVREEGRTSDATLERAQHYLAERGATAELIAEAGDVAAAILGSADTVGADLILIGGYGLSPLREVVMGNTVDTVLNRSTRPVLVCR